jgi:hypothetical protein
MVAKPHASPEQTYCGPVWFVAHTSPAKKLVAYYVLVYVWFVAKILAANGYLSISLTDSCQSFGQVWAEDSLAKILASQFLPTFGRARLGHEPNMPCVCFVQVQTSRAKKWWTSWPGHKPARNQSSSSCRRHPTCTSPDPWDCMQ